MPAPPRTEIPDIKTIRRVLDTERLRLRPFREDDVDALWPHVSNPELTRHLTWSAHTSKDETRSFLAWALEPRDTDLVWAIEHAGQLVGTIGLHFITYALRAWRMDSAHVGYWIGVDHWRKGFATEATRAVMAFGFDELGLHKLQIICVEDNAGSRRVIEKCGFRLFGRQEEDVWREGTWYARLRYELLARNWSDITTTMPISMPPR